MHLILYKEIMHLGIENISFLLLILVSYACRCYMFTYFAAKCFYLGFAVSIVFYHVFVQINFGNFLKKFVKIGKIKNNISKLVTFNKIHFHLVHSSCIMFFLLRCFRNLLYICLKSFAF